MRAYELQNKQGLDALTLVERPDPKPGPGQVVLKMGATSLNYRDLLMVKGAYGGSKPSASFIPLSDGVGEVVSVGDGVTRVKKGDRVAGIFMQKWIAGDFSREKALSALGGGGVDGMLAEYVVLHEEGVVHVPKHLTDEEAATLPCAAVTAWCALVTEGNLKAGDVVLLQGTGGVSIFSFQFAELFGARVIITSSSDEKLERARELGASDLINYKTTQNWDQKAWELTDGFGVDHVVEVGGANTLNQSLRAVRMGGMISLIGVLTGVAADIKTVDILRKKVRVQGIYVGSREMFEAMNRAIALHKLRPVVDRVFPFEEARQALEYLQSGAHFGKICIKV